MRMGGLHSKLGCLPRAKRRTTGFHKFATFTLVSQNAKMRLPMDRRCKGWLSNELFGAFSLSCFTRHPSRDSSGATRHDCKALGISPCLHGSTCPSPFFASLRWFSSPLRSSQTMTYLSCNPPTFPCPCPVTQHREAHLLSPLYRLADSPVQSHYDAFASRSDE